jgi:hypothetical protein
MESNYDQTNFNPPTATSVGVLPPSPLRGVPTGILPYLPVFLVIKKGGTDPLEKYFL